MDGRGNWVAVTSCIFGFSLGISIVGRWMSGIYGFDPPYWMFYVGSLLELLGVLGCVLFGCATLVSLLAWRAQQ